MSNNIDDSAAVVKGSRHELSHATANRAVNPPLCHHCGEPIPQVAATNAEYKIYHGDCYRHLHPPQGGPLHTQSHEELVDQELEQP